MYGFPLARATSPDGGRVYTLYQREGGSPFVHALDTRHRSARCIDLPVAANQAVLDNATLALSADGTRLTVHGPRLETPLTVDTRTNRVVHG